jgi:hypothetical protein
MCADQIVMNPFETKGKYKCLGITVTNQNSVYWTSRLGSVIYLIPAGFLLGILFDPEDEIEM